jgi:hypothetical protein
MVVLLRCSRPADGPVKKGRLTDSAGPTSKLFSLAAAHAGACLHFHAQQRHVSKPVLQSISIQHTLLPAQKQLSMVCRLGQMLQ